MRHAHRPKVDGTHSHDGHAHAHGVGHGAGVHRAHERRRLRWAIALTGSMMVVETAAGLWTNSLALLSDAGHMLTHAFALGVSYVAILLAGRSPGPARTFGWYRFEVLAALFNGVTLAGITIGIGIEAFRRLGEPPVVASGQMFAVAVVGLLVNLGTAAILHGASRHDLNVRSAFLHMLGDTVSSVAIVAGGAVMYFTSWYVVDPLLGVLVATLIAIWSWGLLRDSVHILLESAPRHLDVQAVEAAIRECAPEVCEVTDLHVWEITSQMYSLTAHLALADGAALGQAHHVIGRLNAMLEERFQIEHTTLQLEPAA